MTQIAGDPIVLFELHFLGSTQTTYIGWGWKAFGRRHHLNQNQSVGALNMIKGLHRYVYAKARPCPMSVAEYCVVELARDDLHGLIYSTIYLAAQARHIL